jgi:hypothetical protein
MKDNMLLIIAMPMKGNKVYGLAWAALRVRDLFL